MRFLIVFISCLLVMQTFTNTTSIKKIKVCNMQTIVCLLEITQIILKLQCEEVRKFNEIKGEIFNEIELLFF